MQRSDISSLTPRLSRVRLSIVTLQCNIPTEALLINLRYTLPQTTESPDFTMGFGLVLHRLAAYTGNLHVMAMHRTRDDSGREAN
jgi:hypothetical protein